MPGKRDKPGEIVLKLQLVALLQGQRSSIGDAARQTGVKQQTCRRLRKAYGGMGRDELKPVNQPETEDCRRRRAVSHLTLNKMDLTEAARGNH